MEGLASDSDADLIIKLFYGALKFRVLQQATEFKLFDTIEEMEGAVTLNKLAAEKNYDKRILEKFLNCLVCVGLLKKSSDKERRNKGEEYIYSNSEATKKYLVGSNPGSLTHMVKFIDYVSRKTERDFQVIMEGGIRSVFYTEDLLKRRRSSLAVLQRTLSQEHFSAEGFGLVMDAFTNTCAEAIVKAFDLSHHEIAVDLGGGFGLLAETLARLYPQMVVKVFELPHVIQMAQNLKPNMNVSMVSGDLFTDDLPDADLFILCHVIENWDDDKNHIILQKVFKHLPPGGQLLLVEKFLSDDKTGPEDPVIGSLFSAIMDLEGDYKTEQEYRDLLEKEGFVSIQSKRIEGYNDHDVMLATKPQTGAVNTET